MCTTSAGARWNFLAVYAYAQKKFANDQTKVLEGKFVRVLSWYDNEWGFSNRMADTSVAFAKLI